MKRHPLIAFFVLMFALSWGLWFSLAAALQRSPGLSESSRWPAFLQVVGAFGPCFAALIVTGVAEGTSGLRRLFGQLLRWRVNAGWYAVALLLPAGISLLITALHTMVGGDMPDFANPPVYRTELPDWLQPYNAWTILVPVFVLQLITRSSVGEELGWRGFALTRLQQRFSALDATLIIAVVWAVWAQPLFYLHRVQAGPWLMAEDLQDTPALVTKLRRADDPVTRFLLARFSPPLRALLLSYDGTPNTQRPLEYVMLAELNQLMHDAPLYEARRFQDVALSPATRELAAAAPDGLPRVRLNRLLLEAAYSGEIGTPFRVYVLSFLLLLIGAIPAQILITWVFNSTGGSLLLAVLYTNALKTTDLFLAAPNAGQLVPVAAYWLIALVVVSAVGTKRLTLRPTGPPAAAAPAPTASARVSR